MVKRNYFPVRLNGRPHRIFVDDLINIYERRKKIKPKLPKYVDDDEEKQSGLEHKITAV